MGNNDKGKGAKGAKDLMRGGPSAADVAKSPAAKNNIFSRHGNEQIMNVVAGQDKKTEASVLQTAMSESSEQAAEKSSWWDSDEKVAKAPVAELEKEDEQSIAAKKPEEEPAAAKKIQADKDAQRGRQLTPVEEAALIADKKAAMSSNEIVAEEQQLLAKADEEGMSEEDKAQMLVAVGDVSREVMDEQSGEVRAHLAAEHMPMALADLNRDAAAEAGDSVLNERDTIRNLTDEMRRIGESFHKFPDLQRTDLSVEEKAASFMRILALELDVPTLESVAAHPFIGLHEDLVFDANAVMMVNQIAGSSRDVRAMGSFTMVAWQHIVDEIKNRLGSMDDKEQVEEDSFWSGALRDLSMTMYTDALIKPAPS